MTDDVIISDCDMLVIGSGAGGMAAAVTAAWHGLKVVVIEKDDVFGGAAAWSGGWMWVPGNPLAVEAGFEDAPDGPFTYLRNETGPHFDATRTAAFLNAAPKMVAFFQANTDLKFVDGNGIPDMHGWVEGAATGGHQICAAPIDGRAMGPLFDKLRHPMRETSFLGMPIMAGPDLAAFLNVTRSVKSAIHVAKRVTRHLWDLALFGRAAQLVNGNALMARLGLSAHRLGVDVRISSGARELIVENGKVTGAIVEGPEGPYAIRARAGTVLATGGFPHDDARWQEIASRLGAPARHWSVTPHSATGDGIRLGEAVGGKVDESLASPAAWCPVSLVPYPDGKIGRFPHIIERAKPGIIAVLADGKRFVNEAHGYYDYVEAMIRKTPPDREVASWLICSREFQRRYGFGASRPSPLPVRPFIKSGYLKVGRTIEELANACGILADNLKATVEEYNLHAARGEDPLFGRGTTPFNRKGGDPKVSPNPCILPIGNGPYYAIKVVPGSFGTFMGLSTNEHAAVLEASGTPLPGLFAVGSDMASIMGGFYPSGGINLGPAMTFGYVAGLAISAKIL